jgi:fructokinase
VILSCGEALFDLIPVRIEGEDLLRPVPGGGPFNAAIALARLGVPTGFLGRVSSGGQGTIIHDLLDAEGVDLRYLLRGDDPMTLALVSVLASGDNHYDLYLDGTASLQLGVADLPASLDGVEALHIGTLALAVEPAATAFSQLIEREAGRRVISLDPNVRPGAIASMGAFRNRMERLVALATIVKVSDADLAHLYPGSGADEIAAAWARSGPALVVLTRGADGASAWSGVARGDAEGVPVDVVDTVGAGDTMAGALLAWFREHGQLDRASLSALNEPGISAALTFACRAAAITCSRAGADPPTRADLGFA